MGGAGRSHGHFVMSPMKIMSGIGTSFRFHQLQNECLKYSHRLRIWGSAVRIRSGAPFSETFRAIRTAIARRKVLSLLKNLFDLVICLPAT